MQVIIVKYFAGEEYVIVLEFFMLPSIRMLGLYPPPSGRTLRMAQDNCSVHRSTVVQNWYREHNIELVVWPPYSPDLDIIENVWGRIVLNWEPEELRTVDALHAHTMREWERYRGDGAYFERLAESMPDRIREVRAAGGGHTHY